LGSHVFVVIPAYNERPTILSVINSVPKKISGVKKISIVVVDDGSTDNTYQALSKNIYLVRHRSNRGLGRTFDRGLKYSIKHGADIVVNIDGDGQFKGSEMIKLIAPILSGRADVAIGSRLKGEKKYHAALVKKLGNMWLARLVSTVTGRRFYDVTCGFRAYSREAAMHLNIYDKFSYTLESLVDLAHKDLKIVEIPVTVKMRKFGKSKISSSVFFYTIKSIAILIRDFRDYRPFHFFVLPGFFFFLLSCAGFIILLVRFIKYQVLSPYRSLLSVSFAFLAASLFLFGLGMIFDFLNKIKKNQDDILYRLKENEKQ